MTARLILGQLDRFGVTGKHVTEAHRWLARAQAIRYPGRDIAGRLRAALIEDLVENRIRVDADAYAERVAAVIARIDGQGGRIAEDARRACEARAESVLRAGGDDICKQLRKLADAATGSAMGKLRKLDPVPASDAEAIALGAAYATAWAEIKVEQQRAREIRDALGQLRSYGVYPAERRGRASEPAPADDSLQPAIV